MQEIGDGDNFPIPSKYYDYGENINMKIYRQKNPPAYDMKKVTAPILAFSGVTDALISYKVIFIKLYLRILI